MQTAFSLSARIAKINEEEQFILGIVMVPERVDLQDDIVSASEIRHAAHRWLEHYQTVGLMHERSTTVRPVESYIAPQDIWINDELVPAGSWLLGCHVTDDAIWADIKAGKYTGFSIGGYAERTAQEAA